MNRQLRDALARLFDKHRVVFWYDDAREMREEFDALELDGMEKLEIAGNEFGLRHHIHTAPKDRRFLLYHEGPPPDDTENWLLDMQLAGGIFRADQISVWLGELGLGHEFAETVQQHEQFFRSEPRRRRLRERLSPEDGEFALRLKMLSVCAGETPDMDSILESFLQELAEDASGRFALAERCKLDSWFWTRLNHNFGYASDKPSLHDFALTLFRDALNKAVDGKADAVSLAPEATVFLRRWADSSRYGAAFDTLSERCAKALNAAAVLEKADFRRLLDNNADAFKLIDQKILHSLVEALRNRTHACAEITEWVRNRRGTHWYDTYSDAYNAVEQATSLLEICDGCTFEMNGIGDAVLRYAATWYQADQCYRKFMAHAQLSHLTEFFHPLVGDVTNRYANTFLRELGDAFQRQVDASKTWQTGTVKRQDSFFAAYVRPVLDKNNKICVIVSDALRYEAGEELARTLTGEDRFTAEIAPMLSMLPSYTQLGMAALLPHRDLAIAENGSGIVFADDQNTQGTERRNKILETGVTGKRACARQSEDILSMSKVDRAALVKANDVIYIYHNVIDATGDSPKTEGRVCVAVTDAIRELVRLIKTLGNSNVNNFLVTSDHGFFFQNQEMEDSDFLGDEPEGDILYRSRRFVLGRNLAGKPGLRSYSAAQLGLSGTLEAQIPKSVNLLRLHGAGSRYVHGGATLQEVVIPVVRVNKKRVSDISTVEVDILDAGRGVITSTILVLTLYQAQPVGEKVVGRELRAAVYDSENNEISDARDFIFDSPAEDAREREQQCRLTLGNAADKCNNQQVQLRLYEKIPGTAQFQPEPYKTVTYTLRRSFTADFDE